MHLIQDYYHQGSLKTQFHIDLDNIIVYLHHDVCHVM